MAKGVEDTASYRYLRFVALNEVGGDPGTFGVDLDAFHAWSADATAWPHRLLAGTTHDTKRSESVRARLLTLAQAPDRWREAVERWSARHPFPDARTGYLAWQTLVGAWPLDGDRLHGYLEKAVREAKRQTSWLDPDEGFEADLRSAVDDVLADDEVVRDVQTFVADIIPAGRTVDLGHLLLRLTLPGVPDLYQGSEEELLSLVDPDNRRPVPAEVHRADTPRATVIRTALGVRRDVMDAFGPDGGYEPLDLGDDVIGFVRGGRVATLVPRFPLRARPDVDDVDLPGAWDDVLPGLPVRLLVRRS
jgi:(1->4)-alpha-D-glucan 1-alpha-D-glucosylmutase